MLKKEKTILTVLAMLAISSLVMTTGCFHTGVSKEMLFPSEDTTIEYRSMTIAETRYNFTGAFTETTIPLGAEQKQMTVDNFRIGEGGADLYIYAQVHFGPDSQSSMDFERWVHVKLIYEPGSEKEEIIAESLYKPDGESRYDRAEFIARDINAPPGLYSLKAVGVGTAVQNADVPTYDWFWFTVSGRISEGSYNNNAPDRF
jgi:hypothetical protein